MKKSISSNETTWHQLSVEQAFETQQSGPSGLTTDEAKARLARYGCNELKFKKRSALVRFLMQFNSPLIYILLASAAVTSALYIWEGADMLIDTVVILAVVLANTIIGFIQEGKAEASVEALGKMIAPECTVLRDNNKKKVIPARELVPGDVVILEGGDKVPADMRLFYARNLSADEAAITGESVPVTKHIDQIMGYATFGDQKCMIFSGTFITKGTGSGIVVGTGEQAEIGRIAKLIQETEKIVTPLTRRLADFTRFLIIAILVITGLNFILAVRFGIETSKAFLASVSLAVAAIPEGLPAVVTMALAFGVTAMAQKNAIIKKLPAAETLGCTSVICSDKTGTLTKNQMTVSRIYSGERDYMVSGVGYEPKGEFTPSHRSREFIGTLRASYLCNNASIVEEDGYSIIGDPTEGALLVCAMKTGIKEKLLRLDEIPFESEKQYMATLHEMGEKQIIFVKGSPERILEMCQTRMVDGSIEPINKGNILEKADEMAEEALRVLAMAYKKTDKRSLDQSDLKDMVFLGIQGMIDPPREEAIEGVRKCRSAGIRVVMMTGDYAITAKAISCKLGINADRVITGDDLSKMSDDELYDIVEDVSVYARVAPEHKFRVTKALQKHKHVVAVTGDGVNDAPALKAADIGIAMGITGTEVSKEASDMILADDNFATIVAAVEEGRYVYNNIKKVILYLLPTNGGQALLVLGAILLSPFLILFHDRLPLEPVQILWINLLAAVALALPIIKEPMENDLLKKPPRNLDERITDPPFFKKVGLISIVVAISGFAMYYYHGMPAIDGTLNTDIEIDRLLTQAQTAAFTTVILVHICYAITARSITESAFTFSPFSNRWTLAGIVITILAQLAIVYAPPYIGFNPLKTAPLPLDWWGLMILVALPGFFVIEIEKWLTKRFGRRE
ncbi:MAG: HAD-IC family P-type ATPase [ANME-2 cluster archaeon]|nr:HAD-IC family P-type ATPase [ANME-2 cluster archaeon]MBC2701044.1 HAD-IC family P-type ATPase [ANME-2 cluster archaeon]MBC2708392.1 HAD-IC family P-type ATPase [ANME-2 cluster archaeon]MBC2747465.1 HAD-IC family P-type ATPase [ANME-2 cluster archaeon]MBC2762662.1 HAD-IC family P-type ATPase [ANME-2 cluster archaeon]